MNKARAKKSVIALILAFALAGCISGRSPRAHFYQLQPDRLATPVSTNEITSEVVVGPILLSPYLKRQQMARRTGENEVEYDEVNRWAEPLESNINLVLSDNLSTLLSTDRIFQFPLTSPGPSGVAVAVRIDRFDGSPNGKAVLWANWSFRFADTVDVSPDAHSVVLEPVPGSDVTHLVAAQSELLAHLSRMIAESVAPYLNGLKPTTTAEDKSQNL